MIRMKVLMSICLAISLSMGSVYGISKGKDTNKTEIVEAKEVGKNSDKASMAEEVVIKNEEKPNDEKKPNVDNIENAGTDDKVQEVIIPEESKNVEVKPDKAPESKPVENTVVEAPQEVTEEPQKIAAPSSSEADSYIAEIEQAIFTRVNKERSENGLAPLSYNNTMENYARLKSKDMGDRGYFDHANPEGELITAQMKRDGVNYNSWGENIAYIQRDSTNASLADQFMTNWMNSPGHRANILSGNFASIGVGVYKVGNTYYATQEFYR